MKRRSPYGTTMTEYMLVGVSLILLALVGLIALGKSTQSTILSFANSLAYKPSVVTTDVTAPSGQSTPTSQAGMPNQPGMTEQPATPGQANPVANGAQQKAEEVCFKSGWCALVPDVKNQTLVDTSGSMGSQLTHQFSTTIKQFAKELESQPNPDSRLAQLITMLADSGHELGDQEAQAVKECHPGQQCTGNQGTLRDSLSLIISKQSMFESNLQSVQNHIKDQRSPIPPEIVDIINHQANQISAIAEAYHVQPSPSIDGSSLQWSFSHPVEITHQSANTICNNGGNTGKCVRTESDGAP